MKNSMKHLKPISIPSKNRNSNIAQLSRNLFDKIGIFEAEANSSKQIPSMLQINNQINGHYDSLSQLLSKAQTLTNQNQGKIVDAKHRNKKSLLLGKQSVNSGTFLTGTGLYENENFEFSRKTTRNEQIPEGPSPTEMLKDLIKNEEVDDLAELRRMIKETDENIAACHKKVTKTHKKIMTYVSDTYECSKKNKAHSSGLIKNKFR